MAEPMAHVNERQIKTCPQCGRDILNRPAKTIYCSAACRTAASRKRTAPPAVREVQRLEAEVQQLRTWVNWLKSENVRLREAQPSSPKIKLNEIGRRKFYDAVMVLRARKAVMSAELFTKLRFCVHPDTHSSTTPATLNELTQFVEENAFSFRGKKR
jgi:ribosomal protein L37AE/L43A